MPWLMMIAAAGGVACFAVGVLVGVRAERDFSNNIARYRGWK